MLLSRRAARKHLVASRHPKYFLRLRSAGSVSPGSGRPVRRQLGYGPAVRLKPFRPHLTVGALSCALRPQRAQHAPTARTRQAAGAHPGGFPHRRPSPAPIEPHLHPILVLRSSCARRGITPAFGYGPRLGSVRLDFHQLATRPARRALRPAPTAARPPDHFPVLPVIGGHRFPRPTGDGTETALPGSHDNRSRVQRPLRRRVPQRPLLEPKRFPWPSPCRQRLGTLLTRPNSNGLRITTLTQASHTLQTARSLRPAPHPTSQSRAGASLPGTQASPRTGLAPAGRRELIAPTSCGPPFPHGARAVPAHGDIAGVVVCRVRLLKTIDGKSAASRAPHYPHRPTAVSAATGISPSL